MVHKTTIVDVCGISLSFRHISSCFNWSEPQIWHCCKLEIVTDMILEWMNFVVYRVSVKDYLLRDKMILKLKGYVTEACKQVSHIAFRQDGVEHR